MATFRDLYHNTKYQDIQFELDDGTIYGAHRVVLDSSNVEWFKTILNSSFGDSTSKIVKIKDIESKVFEIALKYAYNIPPYLKNFGFNALYPIFKAASYFLCPGLVHSVIDETKLNEAKILILIDCILQTGFDFPIKWTVKIFSVIRYFSQRYQDDALREMIQETWKICPLDQDDILAYLSAPRAADDEESLILLKKITYNSKHRTKIINILDHMAQRNLIPYSENIHLPLYPKGFIFHNNKIGYLVSSVGFDEHNQMDKFLCGWNSSSRSMIHDIKPGSLPADKDHWYIYYAKPEITNNIKESEEKVLTFPDNRTMMLFYADYMKGVLSP